jgi:hypothetical protein
MGRDASKRHRTTVAMPPSPEFKAAVMTFLTEKVPKD